MAIFSHIQHLLPFACGILGNLISFTVFLAPAPTFYKIVKKKSTEGYQSVPYVVALFSSMIWIYYATIKSNATLFISINAIGCILETTYIAIYIAYAPKKSRALTVKLVVVLNFTGFCSIVGLTYFLPEGTTRVQALGWICLALSISVFAAPLSIMAQVIRTKSVEFMPFSLSFCLLLNAVSWFFYGLLTKDFFIALPNVVGFSFAVVQIVLYLVYKRAKPMEQKLPISTCVTEPDVYPVCSLPKCDEANKDKDDENIDKTDVIPVCSVHKYDEENGESSSTIKDENARIQLTEVQPICLFTTLDEDNNGEKNEDDHDDDVNVDIPTWHCSQKSVDTITCNQAVPVTV